MKLCMILSEAVKGVNMLKASKRYGLLSLVRKKNTIVVYSTKCNNEFFDNMIMSYKRLRLSLLKGYVHVSINEGVFVKFTVQSAERHPRVIDLDREKTLAKGHVHCMIFFS